MFLRISRTLALVTGVLLPAIETWRRWNMLAEWPSWLDDYIAAVLLLSAWWAGRRRTADSRPYLMGAWGYTFGMAYMSFFGQWNAVSADPSGVAREAVLAFKGFGLALAAACLAMAWFHRDGKRSIST